MTDKCHIPSGQNISHPRKNPGGVCEWPGGISREIDQTEPEPLYEGWVAGSSNGYFSPASPLHLGYETQS